MGARRPPARIALCDAYATMHGAGMMLCEIVRRLDRERFEPIAVLPMDGALVEGLRALDCPVEVLPPDPPLDQFGRRLVRTSVVMKLRAAWSLRRYASRMSAWLRERDVRLLHCNQTRAAVLAGPGARLARVPAVWNVRIREQLPPMVVRLAEHYATRIVPLTEDSFAAQPRARQLMRRATVIANAVDLERFTPGGDGSAVRAELGIPAGAPIILSVGILMARKGFGLLIRALPRIVAAHRDARLLIAGGRSDTDPGDHPGELRALSGELGVEEAVHLLGQRSDVAELLAACDVFALASNHEGQPGAVLEAMAAARPVVVTPAAAAGVEHGRSGIVVPEGDVDAIAAAVLELLARPERAREIGRAARRDVEERHDVRKMVRAYERVYLELLGEDAHA